MEFNFYKKILEMKKNILFISRFIYINFFVLCFSSEDSEILFQKGIELFTIEKYDDAIKNFKKAAELSEDNKSEYFAKCGEAYFKLKKYKESTDYYSKAIKCNKLEKKKDLYLSLYGISLYNQIKYEKELEKEIKNLTMKQIKINDDGESYKEKIKKIVIADEFD